MRSEARSPPCFRSPGSSEVVVEVKDLSLSPATVHCPACLQQVTTVVRSKIGSTTFFLCFLSMLLGCVGGCCLLPFCVDNFKDVCHTCPSCHSEISTISRI
uniref:LITAF domain-containing protein n=1 Tax=Electrophorus electricus TaxID=8005 RepID=A0AAY5F032_ELEEL